MELVPWDNILTVLCVRFVRNKVNIFLYLMYCLSLYYNSILYFLKALYVFKYKIYSYFAMYYFKTYLFSFVFMLLCVYLKVVNQQCYTIEENCNEIEIY